MTKTKRIIEGVSGALFVDSKVLVVRRSADDDFLAGYYELPGGKMDSGETREEALVRELDEELGLRVEVVKPYNEFSYQPGPNTQCFDYGYIAKLADGETIDNLQLSFEHDDYKWVGESELNKISPITPEALDSIKKAIATSR